MAKKKVEDVIEEEEFEWDKTRIAMAIGVFILLVIGGIFAKKYILGSSSQNASPSQSVEGLSTNNSQAGANQNFSLPSATDLQQELNDLEQKIQHLSVQDVASASPQVQEIIQQVQNLPNLPRDQAQQVCQKICGSYMK